MDTTSSHLEELEALFKLLEKGAITIDEYEAQKKAILSSPNKPSETISTEKSEPELLDSQEKSKVEFITTLPEHQKQPSSQQPNHIIITPTQPAQLPKEKANSNSVKIFLILVGGLIILVAMYFIFVSGSQSKLTPHEPMASAASMASSVITTSEQKAANNTSSEVRNEINEEDIDETGLNLNRKTSDELNNLLNKYQLERSKAETRLRKVWAELDSDFKRSILDEQKSWDNTALIENCTMTGYKSAEAQQVAKLYCESNVLYNRADILLKRQQENLASIKEAIADQVEQKAVDAIQRLEITWKTIPEDVQKNLNQTHSQWLEETKEYCLSRPTAENIHETKINFNQCITDKVENKIKELNGYKI